MPASAGDLHRLEQSTLVEGAGPEPRRHRAEPVHEAVAQTLAAGVFGQVRPPGLTERHGLVLVPTHRRDRRRVPAKDRVDLEDVAVPSPEIVEVLLTGQPRAPRRRPAGAVVDGPRQADPRRLEPACWIDDQRRGSAGDHVVVVGHPRRVRHRRETLFCDVVRLELVIAHEHRPAAPAGECRHPVVRGGDGRAVVEGVDSLSGEHLVAEAAWQVEQAIPVWNEVAVAAVAGACRHQIGWEQRTERPGEGESGASAGQREEATSVDCHVPLLRPLG